MKKPGDRLLGSASIALLGFCLLRFVAWLPGYLTRPWFADHDVFATMARSWDVGVAPYRDLISNNFPGTIYLFWGLGKAFGWGNVPSLYVADAGLLLGLAAMTLVWSRARFGRALPGAVALVAMTSYYLDLDFSQAAQRDWHASSLVVLGLLASQAWPARGGRWAAALGFAAGMLFRPQVVLLLPALLLATTEGRRLAGESRTKTIGASLAWLAIAALGVFVGFLPLIRAGLFGDFLDGLRALAYGGSYNKKSATTIAFLFGLEAANYRLLAVLAALGVLARRGVDGAGRSMATTWLVALAGVLFYMPLSPGTQPYLLHPLWLVWSIGLGVVVGLILEADAPPKGFVCVLLALHFAGMGWPRFGNPGPVGESVLALRRGREVRTSPAGYQHVYGDRLILPPWEDYRDVLDYLRTATPPGLRLANLLKGVALTGPTARLSALPAESLTWVFVVKPEDEGRFARALEDAPDSVVILWAPGEVGRFDHPVPEVQEVVRRLYRPEARFGSLEVWGRRPKG